MTSESTSAETESRYQENTVKVFGHNMHVLKGGSGDSLVVLHHEIGSAGWTPLHDRLAQDFTVYAPDLPGYGRSERLEWARHPRDLALVMQGLLDELGIQTCTLVGLGFGGWLAAEMVPMNQGRFSELVLVGSMGLRPKSGEIMDQMLMTFDDYIRSGFIDVAAHDRILGEESTREQRALWSDARETTARLAWKPYMFSHQLPHTLAGVRVPTLVVWGRQDKIVPLACADQFVEALFHAKLAIIDDAGHFLDMERPVEIAELVRGHARTGARSEPAATR